MFDFRKKKATTQVSPVPPKTPSLPQTAVLGPATVRVSEMSGSDLFNSNASAGSQPVAFVPIKLPERVNAHKPLFTPEGLKAILQNDSDEENDCGNGAEQSPRVSSRQASSAKGSQKNQGLFEQALTKQESKAHSLKRAGSVASEDRRQSWTRISVYFGESESWSEVVERHFKNRKLMRFMTGKVAEVVQQLERNAMLWEEIGSNQQSIDEIDDRLRELMPMFKEVKSQMEAAEKMSGENVDWVKLGTQFQSKGEELKKLEGEIAKNNENRRQAERERAEALESLKQAYTDSHSLSEQYLKSKTEFFEKFKPESIGLNSTHVSDLLEALSEVDFLQFSQKAKRSSDTQTGLESLTQSHTQSLVNVISKFTAKHALNSSQTALFEPIIEQNIECMRQTVEITLSNQNNMQIVSRTISLIKRLSTELSGLEGEKARLLRDLQEIKERAKSLKLPQSSIDASAASGNLLTFGISLQSFNYLDSVNSLTELQFKEKECKNRQRELQALHEKLDLEIRGLLERQNAIGEKIESMDEFHRASTELINEILADIRQLTRQIIAVLRAEFSLLSDFTEQLAQELEESGPLSSATVHLKNALQNLNDALFVLDEGVCAGKLQVEKAHFLLREIEDRKDPLDELCEKLVSLKRG